MGRRQRRHRKYGRSLYAAVATQSRCQGTEADPNRAGIRLHDSRATAMNRRSLRFRLTIYYAGILGIGLGLLGSLLWLLLWRQMLGEIDRVLYARANQFETYFKDEYAQVGRDQVHDELKEFCQALPKSSYIQLHSADGFQFRCPNDSLPPGFEFRIVRRDFVSRSETFHLEVGAPLNEVDHTLGVVGLLL